MSEPKTDTSRRVAMTREQRVAIQKHCRLAGETAHPQFAHAKDGYSIVLSVNSGYE
jgi:hypothetical protein